MLTRFAPSPTGFLHIGHAFAAKMAFGAAAAEGGICLLRLEDIDQTRCTPAFETALVEDLSWLGFSWPEPIRRQSAHFAAYRDALGSLIKRGLVYRCFRTRREVAAAIASAPHDGGRSGAVFDGGPHPPSEEAAFLAADRPYAWRLSLVRARDVLGPEWDDLTFTEAGAGANRETGTIHADPTPLGDVILARKDAGTSYHLACCHDDALQGVTHVYRGEDLFALTPLHVLLQRLLDYPAPVYCHHPLLLDADGKRFAKRNLSATIRHFRETGLGPAAVWSAVAESRKSR